MKRCVAVVLAIFLFAGCASNTSQINRAVTLRDELLKGNGCSFAAAVTADYGDATYTFKLSCQCDTDGNITFRVMEPSSISDVAGRISDVSGQLIFDDKAVMFEMLADGQITPVSAPWLMIHTLRSGYISACGSDGAGLHIQIDDSYKGESLQMDIWTDGKDMPIRAEFIWKGKRIVSMDVEDFVIM